MRPKYADEMANPVDINNIALRSSLIRLCTIFRPLSGLGPHCLLRPTCPSTCTLNFYSMFSLSFQLMLAIGKYLSMQKPDSEHP